MSAELPVHWLSKEARFKIVDALLSSRTAKSLAEELGVSRSAIVKYVDRETHPSDRVIAKAIEIAAPYERDVIIRIVIDDLVEALKKLNDSLDRERYRKYLLSRIEEAVGANVGK